MILVAGLYTKSVTLRIGTVVDKFADMLCVYILLEKNKRMRKKEIFTFQSIHFVRLILHYSITMSQYKSSDRIPIEFQRIVLCRFKTGKKHMHAW